MLKTPSYFIIISFFILVQLPQSSHSLVDLSRHHHRPNPKHFPVGVDLVNTTCGLCANATAAVAGGLRYGFCTSSLRRMPITQVTSFQGLAIVAMELAMENASETVFRIADMMSEGMMDKHGMAWLGECMGAYSHSVSALLNAVGAFTAEHYVIANAWMLQVTKGIRRCEVRFSRRGREASPLNKHNYDVLKLSHVALCIIQLLEPT